MDAPPLNGWVTLKSTHTLEPKKKILSELRLWPSLSYRHFLYLSRAQRSGLAAVFVVLEVVAHTS